MPEYQKMYVQLFAAVTDALEAMSQQNYGQAADILRKGQQTAEEIYVSAEKQACFFAEFLYNESNDTDSDKGDNEVKKIEADNNAELQLLQEFVTIAKSCLSEGKAEAFLQALVSYERNPKLYGSDEAFLKTVSNLITKTNDKGMQQEIGAITTIKTNEMEET